MRPPTNTVHTPTYKHCTHTHLQTLSTQPTTNTVQMTTHKHCPQDHLQTLCQHNLLQRLFIKFLLIAVGQLTVVSRGRHLVGVMLDVNQTMDMVLICVVALHWYANAHTWQYTFWISHLYNSHTVSHNLEQMFFDTVKHLHPQVQVFGHGVYGEKHGNALFSWTVANHTVI